MLKAISNDLNYLINEHSVGWISNFAHKKIYIHIYI